MLMLFEKDLQSLLRADFDYTYGNNVRFSHLRGSCVAIFEYWKQHLLSETVTQATVLMKEKELLALIAIARKVIDLGLQCRLLSGSQTAHIVTVIEAAHVVRFERKLTYARSNPQLLLEAKAELREKKALTKQS